MKITIDVDCTPQEARAFLGLPDVKPVQDAMMASLSEQMKTQAGKMDLESMMKMWMQPGLEGFGKLQEMMMTAAGARSDKQDQPDTT